MQVDAAIAEVGELWQRGGAGASTLARWRENDDGVTRDRARAMLTTIVQATSTAIPWGSIEKPTHDGLEGRLGIFERAIAVGEPGRMFRISASASELPRGYEITVRAEWTSTPSATLPDHDEVERRIDAAAARVRAIVASPRFGAGTLDDLRGLEGVEARDVDSAAAFTLRCAQSDEGESATGELADATGQLERVLGALRGSVFERSDYRTWNDRIDHALALPERLALDRLDDPWDCEVLLDLKLVLFARAFPSSEEAERFGALTRRVESVLEAGGLVFGLRGRSAESAVVIACPGPRCRPERG